MIEPDESPNLYRITLHGGPQDTTSGQDLFCYRPYHQLTIEGSVYVHKGEISDLQEWVDDDTRHIDLYYKEPHDAN